MAWWWTETVDDILLLPSTPHPPPFTSPLHKISFISIGDSLNKMSNPVFYLFIFQVHFKTKCSYIDFKNSRPKAVFFKK